MPVCAGPRSAAETLRPPGHSGKFARVRKFPTDLPARSWARGGLSIAMPDPETTSTKHRDNPWLQADTVIAGLALLSIALYVGGGLLVSAARFARCRCS